MTSDELTPERRLLIQAGRGGITLVLGAGISVPRGIPNWDTLAQNVWHEVFGGKNDPWFKLSPQVTRQLPQFLPIAFELVYRETGEARFIEILRRHLYASVKHPTTDRAFKKSDESLAVLARLIVQEHHRKSNRRIDAVITLNADDLIEQGVQKIAGLEHYSTTAPLRTFARSTHSFLGGPGLRSIPCYHVHGFLASEEGVKLADDKFNHMLVFTDTQYWVTSGSGTSFANRVMASALGEGCCVFIGLSMTDINLLRWFALRNFETDRDMLSITKNSPRKKMPAFQVDIFKRTFERHFWIRPLADDSMGFLSQFLLRRGIRSVEIESWRGDYFRKLIERCFPASTRPKSRGRQPYAADKLRDKSPKSRGR